MVAIAIATRAPENTRREKRRRLISDVSGLVGTLRRAFMEAEEKIIAAAEKKWVLENPEDMPSSEHIELPDTTHLAELEAVKAALLEELNDAIEKSHAFD